MNSQELKDIWKCFCEKNDFILNPDENIVDMIIQGVLENNKNTD